MPSADLLRPSYYAAPDRAYTLGPLVVELLAGCSDDKGPYLMDPEQSMLLDDWFGYGENDKLASFQGVVIDNRQNKKTATLKAAALGKVFVCEQRLVVWTAHKFFASAEAFRDLRILIESNPDMDREVVKMWTGAGSEAIEFTDDRRLIFKARHNSSGRSLSGDTVILDEGFALSPGDMGALLPTLAARPDPQVLVGSSAGMVSSAVLRAMRDRGRAGAPRMSYAEWQATPTECEDPDCTHIYGRVKGCALDRDDLMREANTAIQRGRISLDTVRSFRQEMPPEEFSRECFGWWSEPLSDGEVAIAPGVFGGLEVEGSRVRGETIFALDVSPRRTWSAIIAGGDNGAGRVHLEVPAARGESLYRRGTGHIVEAFRKLKRKHDGATVRILAKSEAAAFAKPIEALGFRVNLVPMADYPAMCTGFVGEVNSGGVAHLGDVSLTASVESGVLVDVGEDQARWGRKKSGSDITLLVGATLIVDGVRNGTASIYEERGVIEL